MLFSAILILFAASRFPLWGDEAETALFAKAILRSGVPTSWDGTNLIAVRDGLALDHNLNAAMVPWPQLYLAAISFFLFGISPFTARLPFMLCSLLLFILLTRLGKSLALPERTINSMLWIAATNIPLTLYMYQARYYPMMLCLGLLLILYRSPLTKKAFLGYILIVVTTLLSHYLSALLLLAALWVFTTSELVAAPKSQLMLRRWIYHTLASAMGILLWIGSFMVVNPITGHGTVTLRTSALVSNSIGFIRQFADTGLLPVLFVPIGIVYLIFHAPLHRNWLKLPLLLLGIYTALLMLLSITFTSHLNMLDIRYHVIVLPLLIMTLGIALDAIYLRWRSAGILLCIVTLGTTVWSGSIPRVYIWDLFAGTARQHDVPDFAVANFLNIFGKNGEHVFIDKDDAHDPVMFSMHHAFKLVNRMHPDNPKLNTHPYLPRYLTAYVTAPDWIIRYGTGPDAIRFNRNTFPLGLHPDVRIEKDYDAYLLPIFSRHTTRPEITAHMFYAILPHPEDYIVIYRNKTAY